MVLWSHVLGLLNGGPVVRDDLPPAFLCNILHSYAAWSQFLTYYYASAGSNLDATLAAAQVRSFHAARHVPHSITLPQSMRWLIPFWVSYPITSCCLSVSKLLVLDRLMAFSKRLTSQAPLGRIVVGSIVVGSALGFCVNIAASVFLSRSYAAFDAAASSNSTEDFQRGNRERSNGQLAGAFHLFFETLMLLLVVGGLTLGGVSSARRFHSVLISSDQQIANLSGSHRSQELASVTQQQQSA